MDDDDDLWGPPSFVQDDTSPNQTLPGCEFWFDSRTDVIEENFLNEYYCQQAWEIFNKKRKPDAELNRKKSDSASASVQKNMATSESGETHAKVSSHLDSASASVQKDMATSESGETHAKVSSHLDSASASVQKDMATSESEETHAKVSSHLDSASASVQKDMATSESGETHAKVSSHLDSASASVQKDMATSESGETHAKVSSHLDSASASVQKDMATSESGETHAKVSSHLDSASASVQKDMGTSEGGETHAKVSSHLDSASASVQKDMATSGSGETHAKVSCHLDSASVQKDMATSESGETCGETHAKVSSHSDSASASVQNDMATSEIGETHAKVSSNLDSVSVQKDMATSESGETHAKVSSHSDSASASFQNDMATSEIGETHAKVSSHLDSASASVQKDMATSGSGEHAKVSSHSDTNLSAILPDGDTSSEKLGLVEDEKTSSISDAQTLETIKSRDFSNEEIEPQETTGNDPLTGEVAKDSYTSSSPVFTSKIEEALEHSSSSLVNEFEPIKQAPENEPSSTISQEKIGGSTLKPLLFETSEKVGDKANATNEDEEVLKDHQRSDSLQDIITVGEPFTTESLLEMCDEPDNDREIPCNERNKKSNPEPVKTVIKAELIVNLLTEAQKNAEGNALLNPGSVLTKKRQIQSNSSDNIGLNTRFVRNIKQKVHGGSGEIKIDPAHSRPGILRGPSVLTQPADSLLDPIDGRSQRDGHIVSNSVIPLTTRELKNKTGKELRSIARELKLRGYSKLKNEDLRQLLTNQLNLS